MAVELVDEHVLRFQGMTVTAQDGVLPLGGPRPLGGAEELLDLHVAVGQLEDGAEGTEEAVDAS